jgi:UDP-N-acetyl-D-mannosaminuronate dehydrogenase
MKIGIVGYGEIGSSLAKVYAGFPQYQVLVVDPFLDMNDDLSNCHFLNICIPFIENFVEVVQEYIDKFNPKYTVIHSTVSPGTTEKIKGNVCHSPVRGLHPNLDVGIKTFLKYIGSDNEEVGIAYRNHLNEMGIESYLCKSSKTTEYSKLLDTTYYGMCIAFHSDVMSLCEKENIPFYEVMSLYNLSYNEGYYKLGKSEVVRPVLYGTKKIGGHCVVPNAKILKEYLDSGCIDMIFKYE